MKRIPLTKGYEALVDDADYETLLRHRWSATVSKPGYVYAVTRIEGKSVRMHRLLMGAGAREVVDHVNHNTLDNRRSNLRIVSQRQNTYNARPQRGSASKYKGVHASTDKWVARIKDPASGKCLHLGRFDSEIEAAMAYNHAAQRLQGDCAYINDVSPLEYREARIRALNTKLHRVAREMNSIGAEIARMEALS